MKPQGIPIYICGLFFSLLAMYIPSRGQTLPPVSRDPVTNHAEAGVVGICNGVFFSAASRHMKAAVDVQEQVLRLQLDLLSVHYLEGDTGRSPFESLTHPLLLFEGKLDFNPLDPDMKLTKSFLVSGPLEINGIRKEMSIYGTITPGKPGSQYLVLNLDFDFNLGAFMLDRYFENCHDYLHVELLNARLTYP